MPKLRVLQYYSYNIEYVATDNSIIFIVTKDCCTVSNDVLHVKLLCRLRYFSTFFIVLCSSLVWYNWNIISPVLQRWIYVYYYDMPVPVAS